VISAGEGGVGKKKEGRKAFCVERGEDHRQLGRRCNLCLRGGLSPGCLIARGKGQFSAQTRLGGIAKKGRQKIAGSVRETRGTSLS